MIMRMRKQINKANSKISPSGCYLPFAGCFFNFSLALLIKVLLIKNVYFKNRTIGNKTKYKKQNNYCKMLYKKSGKVFALI